MARGNNNNTLILAVVVLLLALAIWYSMKSSKDTFEHSNPETQSNSSDPSRDIEFVGPADSPPPMPGMRPSAGDSMPQADFQLIDVPDEEPAHQLGVGMGPGLYGSGRHTSEMFS